MRMLTLSSSPLPACGERSTAKRSEGGRVRGMFRDHSLSRVPLTRLDAARLATLSSQAGRGKRDTPAYSRHIAKKSVSSASAARLIFGIESAAFGSYEEQSSYFIATLAPREKIISSGPRALIWSTDRVDINKPTESYPFLT